MLSAVDPPNDNSQTIPAPASTQAAAPPHASSSDPFLPAPTAPAQLKLHDDHPQILAATTLASPNSHSEAACDPKSKLPRQDLPSLQNITSPPLPRSPARPAAANVIVSPRQLLAQLPQLVGHHQQHQAPALSGYPIPASGLVGSPQHQHQQATTVVSAPSSVIPSAHSPKVVAASSPAIAHAPAPVIAGHQSLPTNVASTSNGLAPVPPPMQQRQQSPPPPAAASPARPLPASQSPKRAVSPAPQSDAYFVAQPMQQSPQQHFAQPPAVTQPVAPIHPTSSIQSTDVFSDDDDGDAIMAPVAAPIALAVPVVAPAAPAFVPQAPAPVIVAPVVAPAAPAFAAQPPAPAAPVALAAVPVPAPADSDVVMQAPAFIAPVVAHHEYHSADQSMNADEDDHEDDDLDGDDYDADTSRLDINNTSMTSFSESIGNVNTSDSVAMQSSTSTNMVVPADIKPQYSSSNFSTSSISEMSMQHATGAGGIDQALLMKEQFKWISSMIRNMKKRKDAYLFLQPVDPVALHIPTYFDIVKHPMDISTVETKLSKKLYKTPAEVFADFDLMFNNCFSFNGTESAVGLIARKLQQWYVKEIEKLPKIPRQPSEKKKSTSSVMFDEARPRRDVHPPSREHSFASTPGGGDGGAVSDGYNGGYGLSSKKKTSNGGANRKGSTENKFCSYILRELTKKQYSPYNLPFLVPVDPIALGIPHYPTIISHPMDLSTMRKKLDMGEYYSTDDFEADVRLMFSNCFTFNPVGSEVHTLGKRLETIFNARWAEKASFMAQHGESASKMAKHKSSSMYTPSAPGKHPQSQPKSGGSAQQHGGSVISHQTQRSNSTSSTPQSASQRAYPAHAHKPVAAHTPTPNPATATAPGLDHSMSLASSAVTPAAARASGSSRTPASRPSGSRKPSTTKAAAATASPMASQAQAPMSAPMAAHTPSLMSTSQTMLAPIAYEDSSSDEDDEDTRHIQMLQTQLQLLNSQLVMLTEKRSKKRKRKMQAAAARQAGPEYGMHPMMQPPVHTPVATSTAAAVPSQTPKSSSSKSRSRSRPSAASTAASTAAAAAATAASSTPVAATTSPAKPERKRSSKKRAKTESSVTPATAPGATAAVPVKPAAHMPAPAPHAVPQPAAAADNSDDERVPDEITYEQKRELSENINILPQDKLEAVFEIIRDNAPFNTTGEEEIELDIDSLDKNVLWQLYKFVRRHTRQILAQQSQPVPSQPQQQPSQPLPPQQSVPPPAQVQPVPQDATMPSAQKGLPGQQHQSGAKSLPTYNHPPTSGKHQDSSSSSGSESDGSDIFSDDSMNHGDTYGSNRAGGSESRRTRYSRRRSVIASLEEDGDSVSVHHANSQHQDSQQQPAGGSGTSGKKPSDVSGKGKRGGLDPSQPFRIERGDPADRIPSTASASVSGKDGKPAGGARQGKSLQRRGEDGGGSTAAGSASTSGPGPKKRAYDSVLDSAWDQHESIVAPEREAEERKRQMAAMIKTERDKRAAAETAEVEERRRANALWARQQQEAAQVAAAREQDIQRRLEIDRVTTFVDLHGPSEEIDAFAELVETDEHLRVTQVQRDAFRMQAMDEVNRGLELERRVPGVSDPAAALASSASLLDECEGHDDMAGEPWLFDVDAGLSDEEEDGIDCGAFVDDEFVDGDGDSGQWGYGGDDCVNDGAIDETMIE